MKIKEFFTGLFGEHEKEKKTAEHIPIKEEESKHKLLHLTSGELVASLFEYAGREYTLADFQQRDTFMFYEMLDILNQNEPTLKTLVSEDKSKILEVFLRCLKHNFGDTPLGLVDANNINTLSFRWIDPSLLGGVNCKVAITLKNKPKTFIKYTADKSQGILLAGFLVDKPLSAISEILIVNNKDIRTPFSVGYKPVIYKNAVYQLCIIPGEIVMPGDTITVKFKSNRIGNYEIIPLGWCAAKNSWFISSFLKTR